MSTPKDIAVILSKFKAAFPNYDPSDIASAAEVWHEALGHIDADELKAAAMACMTEQNRAFAPSVGEVIGAVMRLRAQASGLPSAAEAWGQINQPRLVRDVLCPGGVALYEDVFKAQDNGAEYNRTLKMYQLHRFDCHECRQELSRLDIHPLVERVARQFGWPDHFPGDNPEADRAHFIRAYETEVRRETERQAQPEPVQKYVEATRNTINRLAEGMRK